MLNQSATQAMINKLGQQIAAGIMWEAREKVFNMRGPLDMVDELKHVMPT